MLTFDPALPRPEIDPNLPLPERLELARRLAVPIPWAPPMPGVGWIPYRRTYRRLIAEAVAMRLRGVIPALESADWRWGAHAEQLVRLLEAAADAPSEAA